MNDVKFKYVDIEYLTQNTINPFGIEYKAVCGDRSIGKTHAVVKYIYKNRIAKGMTFGLICRNRLETDFTAFISKYSALFNKEWQQLGDDIIEYLDDDEPIGKKKKREYRIIFKILPLSMYERLKRNNFENPHIDGLLFDECYAENPNKDEFKQLQTIITTVARRTGLPNAPLEVWLTGNHQYGYSPILEGLNIHPDNGRKQKSKDGIFLFSDIESPPNVINVKSNLIKDYKINEGLQPIITWSYNKNNYALYDLGFFAYICRVEKARYNYDLSIRKAINNVVMKKRGLPPLYVQDYNCLRFVTINISEMK